MRVRGMLILLSGVRDAGGRILAAEQCTILVVPPELRSSSMGTLSAADDIALRVVPARFLRLATWTLSTRRRSRRMLRKLPVCECESLPA